MLTLRERVFGVLVGGAVGDALGAPFEGREPDESRTVPSRGVFTDDTQLTLATCEAIVTSRGLDLEAIATCYAKWFREGRVRGAGSSTTKALRDLAAGAHWALAGARGEHAAGAGAAMRASPLAFLTNLDDQDDRTFIRDFSRITHHHDEAYSSAVAVIAAIQTACSDLRGAAFIDAVLDRTPDSVVRDRLHQLRDAPDTKTILAVTGRTGYAASVVPFAIMLAAEATDLLAVVTTAIRAGGDTDTAGSIAGQIVGARVGFSALPASIADGLAGISDVRQVAADFDAFVQEQSA